MRLSSDGCVALSLFGDEGWTLIILRAAMEERDNLNQSDAWLEHVRLASVRVEGSSGSFVSPKGLLMTNQHVAAASCKSFRPASAITGGMVYAPTPAEELKCPIWNQCAISFEDVTAGYKGLQKQGHLARRPMRPQRADRSDRKESTDKTGL